jgi:hypothetical protein
LVDMVQARCEVARNFAHMIKRQVAVNRFAQVHDPCSLMFMSQSFMSSTSSESVVAQAKADWVKVDLQSLCVSSSNQLFSSLIG